MSVYSMWRDLIRPTIFAYIIVCAILAEIAGAYYLYANYPIVLGIITSAQPHYAAQSDQAPASNLINRWKEEFIGDYRYIRSHLTK